MRHVITCPLLLLILAAVLAGPSGMAFAASADTDTTEVWHPPTTLDDPQLEGHVSVYLPESYNFAGNLIVVPKDRVRPLDAEGAEFMAFIVSGGVTAMGAGKTVSDVGGSGAP